MTPCSLVCEAKPATLCSLSRDVICFYLCLLPLEAIQQMYEASAQQNAWGKKSSLKVLRKNIPFPVSHSSCSPGHAIWLQEKPLNMQFVQLFAAGKSRMSHVGDQVAAEVGDQGWPLGVQLFGRDDLLCVQQFLVKGLLKVDTELCTIEVASRSRVSA